MNVLKFLKLKLVNHKRIILPLNDICEIREHEYEYEVEVTTRANMTYNVLDDLDSIWSQINLKC